MSWPERVFESVCVAGQHVIFFCRKCFLIVVNLDVRNRCLVL